MKETGPSTQLRKWFNHDPSKWEEFLSDYFFELNKGKASEELIKHVMLHRKITLLYASKEEKFNNAIALKMYLERRLHDMMV